MNSERPDPTELVYDALWELLHEGTDESFVIFTESESKKFVQFGVGPILNMDVPLVALSDEEAERAFAFFRMLGESIPKEYNAPNSKTGKVQHGASLTHSFGMDVTMATESTMVFFWTVYALPRDFTLEVHRNAL